ncbi:unnamed protein product [Didymodactylos carnosus]|uniref:Uncharacterized protein n=1 Tax=Didymodactylos carnosus TaxID=1234261 RepID=A0A8S2ITX7_9BILA|nr:unnamed protein product [Didymodactylos carnosus]CAF3773439.1 unnamed protein product [Didymodactylos carnosus]
MLSILSSLQSTLKEFSLNMVDYVEQSSNFSTEFQLSEKIQIDDTRFLDSETLLKYQSISEDESWVFNSILNERYDDASTENVGFYNEYSSLLLSDDGWVESSLATSELTQIICQDSYHHEMLDHVVDELLAYIELNSDVAAVLDELIDAINETSEIEHVLEELLIRIGENDNKVDCVRGTFSCSLSFVGNTTFMDEDVKLCPLHNSSSLESNDDNERRVMEMKIAELDRRIKELEFELDHQQEEKEKDSSPICVTEVFYNSDVYIVIDIA